jgi:putative membrane protein
MYGVLTGIFTFLYELHPLKLYNISPTFHTVLGLVIGLLLVFRTNTAYDRWWEGRKHLGALVNTSRHFSMKVHGYLGNEELIQLIKYFPYVLKEHLRKQDFSDIPNIFPASFAQEFETVKHKPNLFITRMSQIVLEGFKDNTISGEQLIILENEIEKLSNILGACERIRNTPIPFGYSIHLKRILLIYLLTLPFGFIREMSWWCIPLMMMVFFTMIGIELIGEEIEDPFGVDVNDLPFDELQVKIEGNVDEIVKL